MSITTFKASRGSYSAPRRWSSSRPAPNPEAGLGLELAINIPDRVLHNPSLMEDHLEAILKRVRANFRENGAFIGSKLYGEVEIEI